MRSERERLLDILEAIERIEKYAVEGKGAFDADELIQNWMINHISVKGEACRSLPNEFQARYANVPWSDIIGMRTILVHHYFSIDEDAVRSVVEKDIPELKFNIETILKSLDEEK